MYQRSVFDKVELFKKVAGPFTPPWSRAVLQYIGITSFDVWPPKKEMFGQERYFTVPMGFFQKIPKL